MSRKSFGLAGWACALALLSPHVRASHADAVVIDANIQARHFLLGSILNPIFVAANSNQITAYTRCGDSADLTLYSTGIRNRSSLPDVQVTINGNSVPVLYAGYSSSLRAWTK
jgi:hypothetical protein